MGDHRTIHQVHALGGQCRLGDRSFLLAPDIQWSLRFPMKEVCFLPFVLILDISVRFSSALHTSILYKLPCQN
jgi:hypothetical protein